MFQLLFRMLILFLITLIYTYVINKFTKNKIVFFVPTIVGVLWYLLQLRWFFTKSTEGIEDLGIYFGFMLTIIIIFSNVFCGLIFLKKDKKEKNDFN